MPRYRGSGLICHFPFTSPIEYICITPHAQESPLLLVCGSVVVNEPCRTSRVASHRFPPTLVQGSCRSPPSVQVPFVTGLATCGPGRLYGIVIPSNLLSIAAGM
jgi:hypothetical protein